MVAQALGSPAKGGVLGGVLQCGTIDNLPARCKLLGNMVTTWLLAAVLCVLVLQAACVTIALVRIRHKARSVEAGFRSFIIPPNDKTPSQLAVVVDQMAQLVGRAVIAQAKATFMGEASSVAKAANKDAADATMARVPWLSAIATLAPGFSKSLMKNPALLAALGNALGGNHRGTAPPPATMPSGNHHSDQSSMQL